MRILRALLLLLFSVPACTAATRHYYIAAEDVPWNYAPSAHDLTSGAPIRRPWLKLEWPKTRFIEYTDDTFTTKKPQPDWLGILGPVIRAEVGDEIIVDFLNRSRFGRSIHPHGVRYDKADEGARYLPLAKGEFVASGRKYTYHWFAIPASGPGPGQPSSIVWWYHSHVEPSMDINSGLLGPIIITAKGKARPDGSPKEVDREFVTDFQIFDQMGGKPEGLFYAINGYIFGNLPGLYMKQGDRVRWYLLAMGNEVDLHTPHWHGETVTYEGRHADVVELLPGSMKTVDMIADNPGSWMFHCHVEDHMEAGMMAIYTIYKPQTQKCPLEFAGLEFWNHPENSTLTIRNTSGKTITNLDIASEVFLAPQDLQRPYQSDWVWHGSIPPGKEQVIEERGVSPEAANKALGSVFFPLLIQYEDGSKWKSESPGECFKIFWRDPQHPDVPALPPQQIEINAD